MIHPPLDPTVDDVLTLLYDHYGRPDVDEELDDILATLVVTILSQATTNQNSSQAFASLLDQYEGDWHRIAHAPEEDVAAAIVVGGLANRKAPRIQAILKKTFAEQGMYSLEHLHELTPEEAYRRLLVLDGVGPKTASFVLMRAANMPLFAMNQHILRLSRRLGWIATSLSDVKAHNQMLQYIPDGQHESAHMILIQHCRTLCSAQSPQCTQCPLDIVCPSFPLDVS